jgi:hypothetical protein
MEERKDGEESGVERSERQAKEAAVVAEKTAKIATEKNKGIPQQGRPKNAKDKTKRKEKTFKPRVKARVNSASLMLWAQTSYDKIGESMRESALSYYGKKNLRSLSHKQTDELEDMKSDALYGLEPFAEVTEKSVVAALSSKTPQSAKNVYNTTVGTTEQELHRTLTIDEKRSIRILTYIEG